MNTKGLVYCFFFILLCATAARADGLPSDPNMQVDDPLTCGEGCIFLEGTTFTFQSNGHGGGFLTFENDSDVAFRTLLIEETGIPADAISCTTNAFATCVTEDLPGGATAMFLSGGDGILDDGTIFTINLNDNLTTQDPNGSGGWGANRLFSAAANVPNPVSEPATLALLAAGIAVFVVKRKQWSLQN